MTPYTRNFLLASAALLGGFAWILYSSLSPDFYGKYASMPHYLGGYFLALCGCYMLSRLPFCPQRFSWHMVAATLLCIPMFPGLSDDIFRYLWDGQIAAAGISPYQYTPEQIAGSTKIAAGLSALYPHLNSPRYYSVYPPLSQLFFHFSALLAGDSLLLQFFVLKVLMALCWWQTIRYLYKILTIHQLDKRYLYLFALNPLVLCELIGQGHSEVFMVTALSGAVYYYLRSNAAATILLLSLATAVKLYPLLFFPFLLGERRYWKHLWIAPATGLTLFIPYYTPDALAHILESLRLYRDLFAFNSVASSWAQKIGEWLEISAYKSFAMGCWLVFLGSYLLHLAFYLKCRAKIFLRAITLVMFCYLVFNPTVHPWYVVPFLSICLLDKDCHWTIWAWSATLPATYLFYGAWREPSTQLLWTSLEYILLLATFLPWVLQYIIRLRSWAKYCLCEKYIVGNHFLDNGCGEGYLGEIVQSELDIAVQNLDVIQLQRVTVSHAIYDGSRVPFADNHFTTTACVLMLHHCSDPEQVLREVVRVTSHRLIICESTFESQFDLQLLTFLDKSANFIRSFGKMGKEPLYFKSPSQWQELFAKYGLQVREKFWASRFIHKHIVYVLDK